MDIQLQNHLEHLKLGQYIPVLQENGYESWNQLKMVQEEDFDLLGVLLGHRRRLQREIATMEGYPQSEPLPYYISVMANYQDKTTFVPLEDFSPSTWRRAMAVSSIPSRSSQSRKRHCKLDASTEGLWNDSLIQTANKCKQRKSLRGKRHQSGLLRSFKEASPASAIPLELKTRSKRGLSQEMIQQWLEAD